VYPIAPAGALVWELIENREDAAVLLWLLEQ